MGASFRAHCFFLPWGALALSFVILVGLTGGLGSGKSHVAKALAAKGARVVDADQLAREVVQPGTPALAEIVDFFGAGVINDDGTLNRAALASIVFADKNKLKTLEDITHPAIRDLAQLRIIEAERDGVEVFVYENSILVQMGSASMFDLVVAVTAPREQRIERAVARGMNREDATRRIDVQGQMQEMHAVADWTIDNSGDLQHLDAQISALWSHLTYR